MHGLEDHWALQDGTKTSAALCASLPPWKLPSQLEIKTEKDPDMPLWMDVQEIKYPLKTKSLCPSFTHFPLPISPFYGERHIPESRPCPRQSLW
jgi:hypothetical protein